jgi:transposase
MWTDTTRAIHARKGLALPSDLTDGEWAVLEPLLPPALLGGRPRKWPTRRLVEAMLYMLHGGLPWQMLQSGFPPMTKVPRYFYAWRDSWVWQTINHYLLMDLRVAEGREASPCAGVIDSQSVKTTKTVAHGAMMRARRSKAGSAISSPITAAISSTPRFTPPIFKIATARR